jgi:hypothetical protein
VIDLAEIVRGEYHENAIRENFRPTEVFAIYEAAGPIELAAAKARMLATLKRGTAKPAKENFLTGQTRDKIGKFCGVSGRTLEKIIAIMEAAIAAIMAAMPMAALRLTLRRSSASFPGRPCWLAAQNRRGNKHPT